jgi:hypothetical protein
MLAHAEAATPATIIATMTQSDARRIDRRIEQL